ncbi:MAG: LiaF transmembrane domain-containing protein [Bacteroidia bacterium]
MEHHSHSGKAHNGRFFGFILILFGVLWLLNRLDYVFFPAWLISVPSLMVLIGLLVSIKTKFQRMGPIVVTLIGAAWLIRKHELLPPEVSYLFWPIVLIAIGIIIVLKPKKTYRHHEKDEFSGCWEDKSSSDELEIDAIFCGSKKQILSKDFKGGEINLIFGGTELNLSQADFQKEVVIDVTIVFGGLKIIIPNNWELKTQLTTIAAGVEDKRRNDGLQVVPDKVLLLKGTVIFGGIDIQNH